MVKLRKAFSLNIHLHIRQGMLQHLWDKYVPTSSPEYEQIQLVYLGEQARGGQVESGQANLLISLVLKNRIMQMGLEKCPVKTAYVREQMENSLQRMGRFYLTQLKCCNFVMYRKAERFMSLLEQAETGRNRYLKWQKESGDMEKQRENYRMFSRFAVNIKEFLTEHSQQTMRAQEMELLHLLSKKEYRSFRRLSRLESNPGFLGEQNIVGGQNIKWKKNKDKMLHSIEQLETTKIRRLWAQMEHLAAQGENVDTVLMHKLMQVRQQYRRETARGFWEHVLSVLDNEEFQAAADMAEISRETLKRQLVEEEHAYLSGQSVYELLEHIESVLENEKSRIEKQETRMFASYQEIYQEVFASVWRESHLEEKAARKMLVDIHQLQEEKKEEFVEELATRILLRQQVDHITDEANWKRSFGYTEHEIDGLISYIAYVIEKKGKWETGIAGDMAEGTSVHTPEPAEREAEELFLRIASVIEKKKSANMEGYAEEEVQEILSYIADKREPDRYSEYAQTVFAATENMHHSADGQEERRMLLHFHNLETEERTELIEKLAERVLLQQKAFDTKEETERVFGYTGEQIEGLLSYVSFVVENKKKTKELISQVSEVEEKRTEEIHATEITEREAEELFLQIASVIEKKKSINTDSFANGKIEELFSYIVDRREKVKYSEYAQAVFTVTENMHHSADGQEERKMLLHLHNLETEERTELIEKLAERVLLQQGTYVAEDGNFREIVDREEELSYRIADTKEESARIFGYTGEQIEGLLSYVSYVVENKKKAGEMVTRLSEVSERRTEEVHATEETYTTELAEREAEELFSQIISVMEKKYYSVDGQEERKMLLHLHNLETEERTEFVEKLAESVLMQQGTYVTEDENFRETDVSKEELSYRIVDTKEGPARIFGYTGEQIEKLLSYVSYVVETKKEETYTTELAEREAEELFSQITAVIEKKNHSVDGQEEREILLHLHSLEAEERTELIEKLAESVLMQQGAYVAEDGNFRETDVSKEKLSYRIADTREGSARLQRSIAGGQDIQTSVSAPYEKLWEWGKALLFHPEQGDASTEVDFLPTWNEESVSAEGMPGHNLRSLGNGDREEIQTEVIRRQIEAAKERNTLSQLIEQINHRIDFVQEEEKQGSEPKPEEKLVYADSQLNQPEVKSLLNFIKGLDEGQYGKLVEELSEITKLQWKLQSQGSEEIETMQVKGGAAEQGDVDRKQPKFLSAPGSLGRQYMAIAYPALVYRIEEFEKYRQREVREKIQSLGRTYLQQVGYLPEETAVLASGLLSGEETVSVGNLRPGEEPVSVGNLRPGEEPDNIWLKEGRMLDLQYNMPSPTVSEEEQQQERVRMREESAQLKLAQEQIDKKLKEVEVQLQKVETSARAKEDVRAFAEQVKSQLYEELHVEKLRRGLI